MDRKNEIIRTNVAIIAGEEVQTVNARALWLKLGSKQEFSAWIKDRVQDFVIGQDFTVDKFINGKNRGRFSAIEYTLTLDTAKHICMLERNEAGKRIRQYFIEIEKELRRQERQRRNQPSNEVLMATIYKEMERRIKAEAQRDEMENNFCRIANNPLWTLEAFTKGQALVDLIMLASQAGDGVQTQNHNFFRKNCGECEFSKLALSKRWDWSRGKVDRFFDYLTAQGMI